MGKKIFISYRRADAQMTAGRLHDDLVRRFSAANVFRDKEAIRPGFDWVEEIQQALNEGVVVLALIGPQWAGSRDSQGRRRLDDPEDPNRVELETALAKNAPLIPVLVEGATIPGADELPASLKPLTRRNAIRLRDDDWDADLARLADAVSSLGVASATTHVAETQAKKHTPKVALWAGVGLLAIVVLVGTIWTISNQRAAETAREAIAAEGPDVASRSGGASASPPAGAASPAPLDRIAGGGTSASPRVATPRTANPPTAPPPTTTPEREREPEPATATAPPPSRTTTYALAQLLGEWRVVQRNADGSTFEGTLSLTTRGGRPAGMLAWKGLRPAQVIDASVGGDQVEFRARYPDGVVGVYTASIAGSGTAFVNGRTEGGGSVGAWSGRRLSDPPNDLAQLSGVWAVMQRNRDGSTNEGTLTLRMLGSTLRGTLAWSGLQPAQVTDARVNDAQFEFRARYPDGIVGTYTASIGGSGAALVNGHTEGGGSSATWSGRRLDGRGRGVN